MGWRCQLEREDEGRKHDESKAKQGEHRGNRGAKRVNCGCCGVWERGVSGTKFARSTKTVKYSPVKRP